MNWMVEAYAHIPMPDGTVKYKFNDGLFLKSMLTWLMDPEELGLDIKTIYENDQILVRPGENGCYSDGEWRRLRSVISNQMKELNIYTQTRLGRVQDLLIAQTNQYKAKEFDVDSDVVCFENGVLDYKTGTLRDHHEQDLFMIKIPHNYQDGDASVFEQFLEKVVHEQYREFVWIWIGYVISNHRDQGVALIMKGTDKGNNGKNTLAEVIAAVLGEELVTFVPFKNLTQRFAKYTLVGKKLSISSEVDQYDLKETGPMKTLITESRFWAEKKGHDGAVYNNRIKIMVGMNNFPRIPPNVDLAFLKRFAIVPFPFEYLLRNEDLGLLDELVQPETLVGIIYKATQKYLEFKKTYNTFRTYFKEKMAMDMIEDNRSRWLGEIYPISQFVDEKCEVDDEQNITRSNFVEAFKMWMELKAIPYDPKYYTMTRITQSLKKLFGVASKGNKYYGLNLYGKKADQETLGDY